ncbi:MAG: septum formation initiator family protein [Alphaproteobacteria bacterium]|nr:septum formation initiator family protein [Alphaproteobacteria bacterium SS10]MBV6634263.1 septum formation initiator family protein [Alphaproteobacteria bacterium SS10]
MLQTIIGSALIGYFGYHAIQGDSGFSAMVDLQTDVAALDIEREELRAERTALAHRAALLRDESLDPDLLEERIRSVLHYAGPSDRVIVGAD